MATFTHFCIETIVKRLKMFIWLYFRASLLLRPDQRPFNA